MAAETLTAARAAVTHPRYVGPGGGAVCAAHGTYTIAANVEDGDIFEMCWVPAGCTVIGGWLMGPDLDTNATETLDMMLGWAANGDEVADPNGFGELGVITGDVSVHLGAVGIFMPLAGVLHSAGPKTFNADTLIQVEANAVAATGGTGTITLVVLYTTP